MATAPRDTYLASQVLTASPQKLRLMLIEAALRHVGQAGRLWQAGRDEAAGEAIIRCQEIVAELVAAMRADRDPQLVGRVAGVYVFVFSALTSAQFGRDQSKLAQAARILEIERETWRQVCEQLAGHSTGAAAAGGQSGEAGAGPLRLDA